MTSPREACRASISWRRGVAGQNCTSGSDSDDP